MLEGLDEIDWSVYRGAYGSCTEAPEILRAIADPDPEAAREGRFEFSSSIWHQGTVYPVTAQVVPFLIELASTGGVHQRDHLLRTLGALTDPQQCRGPDVPAVRQAVIAGSAALLPQIEDPDPAVRAAAVYTLGRCGGHILDTLRRRWDTETDRTVRAQLLVALAHNDAAGGELLQAAVAEPGPVPAAAALAYAKAGLPLPPATVTAVAASFATAEGWRTAWSERGALNEVMERLDAESADSLATALLHTDQHGRARLGHALLTRFRASRSAPAALMPQLRALLSDPDAAVVEAALRATVHAGAAASQVADVLARIAAAGLDPVHLAADDAEPVPDPFDPGGPPSYPQPASTALATLVRLRDRRWRDPAIAAWEAGYQTQADRLLSDYVPAFDPVALDALRRRITTMHAAGAGNPLIDAVLALVGWGPDAAPAVPELIAALPVADAVVSTALAAIGPAAHQALPALRRVGGTRAGYAIWQLTGDPEPLLAATADLLDRPQRRSVEFELRYAADTGPAAAPLAARLRRALGGGEATNAGEATERLAYAQLLWRATGDPAEALPVVNAALRRDHMRAFEKRWAAERAATGETAPAVPDTSAWSDPAVAKAAALAAELAPAAGRLRPLLHNALADRHACAPAARALWRHGTDQAQLIEPLLAGATDWLHGSRAVALLVEMDARNAAVRLAELAERDERCITSGSWDETVWEDERLRQELRQAAAVLSG
jgi:hypothetical protein